MQGAESVSVDGASGHSCDAEIRATPNGWATSGHRQEGETWTCSCGRVWVHICDEAEGCSWVPNQVPSVTDEMCAVALRAERARDWHSDHLRAWTMISAAIEAAGAS